MQHRPNYELSDPAYGFTPRQRAGLYRIRKPKEPLGKNLPQMKSHYGEIISGEDLVYLKAFPRESAICGIAILDQEVFISHRRRPYIDVYDSAAFEFKRQIKVKGMTEPKDTVCCSINKCLYTSELSYLKTFPAILKIDPTNGNLITSWNIDRSGGQLSVASDTNVILNINHKALLNEFTADGKLIRQIDLSSGTAINRSLYAVKLTCSVFLVCHCDHDDPLGTVCLISTKESTTSSDERIDEVEILNIYGAEQGESISRLMRPIYLSVSKDGMILVSDELDKQAALLSPDLKEMQILVSKKHGMDTPWRTCFDESTGQWFVADNQQIIICRVKDEGVGRKRYKLIGLNHEDAFIPIRIYSKFHSSELCIMGAGQSMHSEPSFIDKYTTRHYYLSRGSAGNVYGPIPWQDTQLAIKQVTFVDGKNTDEFKKDIEVKKDIWISLDHKHLTRIHWVDLSQLPKVMLIVMEFAAGGSLNKTLRSLGPGDKLPIYVVTDWAKQIAEGMLYLHQKNIVHRDLKSANVLLMKPFDFRDPRVMMTLKIADFDEVKDHDHTTTMSFVGTCAFMAPEVLQNQWFSKTSDVWSFGVMLWEMLTGDIPHKGLEPSAIMHRSYNGKLELPFEQSFPEDYKLLLTRCWESTFTKRPSFREIFFTLQRMDKYASNPVLIKSITTNAAGEIMKSIKGLTILDKELFVLSENGSEYEIEVYDSIKLSFSRRLHMMELIRPMDIGSCNINKCLYIFDGKDLDQSNEILRVDSNGALLKSWLTGDDDGNLSITDESNIILSVIMKHKLNEYSPDGQLLREINVSPDSGVCSVVQAIKLTNGHFLLSCGFDEDDIPGVSTMDADGKLLRVFQRKRASNITGTHLPFYLSVDGDGFFLVADQMKRCVLLLDSNLEIKRKILSDKKHGLQHPSRFLLDDSSGRMLLADNGRILFFRFR